jgi:hypothetical protein
MPILDSQGKDCFLKKWEALFIMEANYYAKSIVVFQGLGQRRLIARPIGQRHGPSFSSITERQTHIKLMR